MAEDPLSEFFESLPLRGAAQRQISASDLEAAGGMPVAQTQELMQAFGLPVPGPDEGTFTQQEADALIELWRQRDIWPFESGVRIGRLYGRLLARIAQASIQQWFSSAAPRLREIEPDPQRRADAAARSFERLLPAADVLLTGVHRRWVEREAAQLAVRQAESALLNGVSECSILFCDLKDFTAFADRQGDGAAVRIIDTFAITVTRERGEEVRLTKLLGDGFMLIYPEPASAVRAATRIIDAMRAPGQPGIHASVHHGPVIAREGDYFGSSVNLAARLLALAGRDELLATAPVVEACPGTDWEHYGSERVRGVSGEIEVFRLAR